MSTPVTIIAGTLGAGKTTLLDHVLATEDTERDVAVLVNDVGEINIDAPVVRRTQDEACSVVELADGCICCGIQGEFQRSIVSLAKRRSFDALLVEPSGISDPRSVAEAFAAGPASQLYTLDSVTTVVDAKQAFDAFDGEEISRSESVAGAPRPLSALLADGIEFCDLLVLNKCDLLTDADCNRVRETLRTLQCRAPIMSTTYGEVPPDRLLDTGRFDPDAVADSPGWKQTLDAPTDTTEHNADHASHDDHDHAHPPEVYGIDSFVYERHQPIDPDALQAFLSPPPEALVRAKGYIWVAGEDDRAFTLDIVGSDAWIESAGRWIASLSPPRQAAYRDSRKPDWHDVHGDRKTELVLIGQSMDRAALVESLDDCLRPPEATQPTAGEQLLPARDGDVTQL